MDESYVGIGCVASGSRALAVAVAAKAEVATSSNGSINSATAAASASSVVESVMVEGFPRPESAKSSSNSSP